MGKYWRINTDICKLLNTNRTAYALNYKSPVQFRTEQGFEYLCFSAVYFCLTISTVIRLSELF